VACFRQRLEELMRQTQAGELALCFFDESGFSPNPRLQSGWSLRGQTKAYCPEPHRQRVNVPGCLRKCVRLVWETVTHTVERQDVIAFFDSLELNAIEILWKQAKYFWRPFVASTGAALRQEVEALMQGFGQEHTIDFQ